MNMTIWEVITGVVALLGSNAAVMFFTRRKYRAEVSTNELQNVQKALEIYTNILNDMGVRLEKMQERIINLETDLMLLKEENSILKLNEICPGIDNCKFKNDTKKNY